MPNPNNPRGLIPVRHRNGAPYTGSGNIYYVPASYATALFIGDPVIGVTTGSDGKGIPTIQRATAAGGNFLLGSVVGFISAGDPPVTRTQDKTVYRPASTESYVLIEDDPDVIFEIQEDSVGGNMGAGAPGRNVDLIAGAGSTITGYSGWMADSSTLQTTNTLQLRIMAAVQRADNDVADAGGFGKWLVAINLHSQRNLTGV